MTVRVWATRGLIQRHGTSPEGRALYDVDAVLALAVTRGYAPVGIAA